MNNDTIYSLCKRIHDSPEDDSLEINEFKLKYPKLYDYVRNEEYDENMLEMLLSYRNKIDNDVVGVNMTVAEHIADKYLYNDSTLQRPSKSEMERCRAKVRNMVKER